MSDEITEDRARLIQKAVNLATFADSDANPSSIRSYLERCTDEQIQDGIDVIGILIGEVQESEIAEAKYFGRFKWKN